MVRRDVVAKKVARSSAWLDEVDRLLARPVELFKADLRDRDLTAFYLLLAIQEVLDLAAHWVADAGWSPPDDAPSTFDVLADHGVIDRALADALHRAASLRNRIAHGYATVDHARLHTEAADGLAALRRFLVRAADAAGI